MLLNLFSLLIQKAYQLSGFRVYTHVLVVLQLLDSVQTPFLLEFEVNLLVKASIVVLEECDEKVGGCQGDLGGRGG